jgi:hypothetical protein
VTSLRFGVTGARAEPHAAVPTLILGLQINEEAGARVHALALRCQIRIEPQRRRYGRDEEEHLYELFGDTPRWGDSLRPFLWTHVSATIGGFSGSTEVELPVVCTYDFEVAAAKYLHALEGGEVPLILLFSGTVFTRGASGFSAEPVSWAQEATFGLPVALWRSVMDLYFPNSGWLRLSRESIDALQRYKASRALPTWDQAVEQLIKESAEDPGVHPRGGR